MSSQLKEVFEDKGVSTKGGTANLATGGKPLTATLGKLKLKPPPMFTNESLNKLQLKMGASDRKMKVLGNFLRVNCGRDTVKKHQEHMTIRNQKLEDYFSVKSVSQTEYVTKDSDEISDKKKKVKEEKKVEKPVVYANNVEELVTLIMEERGLTPDTSIVQIGIDDGQVQDCRNLNLNVTATKLFHF